MRERLRRIRRTLTRRPSVDVSTVVTGLYLTLAVGAAAAAIGLTAFVTAHVDAWAGATVGGVLVSAYAYVGLRVAHDVRTAAQDEEYARARRP